MIVYGLLWSFSDLIWYWTWSCTMVNDRIWSNMVFYGRIWSYMGSDLVVYGEYVQIWSCMWSYMVVCVRIWSDMIKYVILYGRICWNMVKYDRVSDLIWSYMFEFGPIRSSMWSYMWSFLCCSEFQRLHVFQGFQGFQVSKVPLAQWWVNVGQLESVSSWGYVCRVEKVLVDQHCKDTGRDGSYWTTLSQC